MASKKVRSRAKEGPAFIFVDAEDTLVGNQEMDVRARIRQHAARFSHRKQKEKEKEIQKSGDLVQGTQVLDEVCNVTAGGDLAIAGRRPDGLSPTPAPSLSLSYNGYETLRVKYNFDITDLANFADVDFGRTACLLLQDQPARLASLLRKWPMSFLSFLPSRYGSSPCLDYAIRCVAARAGQMLGFPTQALAPFALHAKALSSLQAALNDQGSDVGADIYGAVRLLAIYELLDPSEVNHWIHHNRGGIMLVERRGAEAHKSKFDLALLKGQGAAIIVNGVYKNERSIFESSSWQDIFQQESETETDADSCLWWQFFRKLSYLPGILKDQRALFQDPLPQPQYLTRMSDILERTMRIYQALRDGHTLYQYKDPHPPSLFDLPVSAESPDRIRLREFFLYGTIYVCRMRATLSPSEIERAAAEVEAQSLAAQALLIERMSAELDPVMVWHLEIRNTLAHSIIETREEWLSNATQKLSWEELRVFLAQRWLKWENSWRYGVLTKEFQESRVEV